MQGYSFTSDLIPKRIWGDGKDCCTSQIHIPLFEPLDFLDSKEVNRTFHLLKESKWFWQGAIHFPKAKLSLRKWQTLELVGKAENGTCVGHDSNISTPHSRPERPSYLSSPFRDWGEREIGAPSPRLMLCNWSCRMEFLAKPDRIPALGILWCIPDPALYPMGSLRDILWHIEQSFSGVGWSRLQDPHPAQIPAVQMIWGKEWLTEWGFQKRGKVSHVRSVSKWVDQNQEKEKSHSYHSQDRKNRCKAWHIHRKITL